MKTVRIKKSDLIATVRENLITHRKEFEIAYVAYVKSAMKILDESYAKLRDGERVDMREILNEVVVPTSYEDSYLRVIKMLEMSAEDTIELTEEEFNRYVMDNWQWSSTFKLSNSFYSGKR